MKAARPFIIFGFLSAFALQAVRAQDGPLTVIANPKSVPSEMKMTQVKSILKGEKLRWDDGTKVVIALMKTNTPVGSKTCRKVYNMSENEVNKYFLALVFQGKVKAPTFFNSVSDLEAFVAETPGAIGVIEKASSGASIKTVMVDGKRQI
jgi:hypothetical protein